MVSRTQIVCLHEGKKGRSIDPVFINALIRGLNPAWIRPHNGSNLIRPIDCGGQKTLIEKMPAQLKICLNAGGNTTLMVWADVDHDKEDCEQLKQEFWKAAEAAGVSASEFSSIVFAFAKDRLENWIQFLTTGMTDENLEGPRVRHYREVAEAAKTLANRCQKQLTDPPLPPSLAWSCRNWRALVERMRNE